MIDELRLNTKLFGFDGIIGRRDYFLNLVYILIITTILMFPYSCIILSGIGNLSDFLNITELFWKSSILLKVWTLLAVSFIIYLDIANSIRRLNDINGKVNKKFNIALGIFTVINGFCYILPYGILFSTLLTLSSIIITLFLLCKKGKVTGKLPYDFRKEFNWGAFFGTWLWGIVNKSYHTFWIWILGWTPIGFYYQLLCGIKGNEWAYKNRKWKSDEEFKASQEKQTIVFVILSLIVLPIVIFLIVMFLVFAIAFTAVDEAKTSPNHESATMNKLEKVVNSYTSLFFESHELTANENKFYVLPEDWKSYSFSEKKDILDMAATTAASERSKNGKHSSKAKELPRTKIYSSLNSELLGEFIMDESVLNTDKPDFKAIVVEAMKAYRFYNPTKIK